MKVNLFITLHKNNDEQCHVVTDDTMEHTEAQEIVEAIMPNYHFDDGSALNEWKDKDDYLQLCKYLNERGNNYLLATLSPVNE